MAQLSHSMRINPVSPVPPCGLFSFDIIQCSLISLNFRVLVARVRTKLNLVCMTEKQRFSHFDEHDEIRSLFDRPPPTISLDEICSIKFFWLDQKKSIDRLLRGKTRVRLNKDLWMGVVDRNIVIYNSNPEHSKLADYRFILDVIFGTFLVDHFTLGFATGLYCIMPKEIMFPLALRYRNSGLHFTVHRSSVCAALTSDELSALLDNLTASKVKLHWNVERGAVYSGTLKTRDLLLNEGSWITLDHLLTLECEQLYTFEVSFTRMEFMTFIRKWQEGGFEKLKRLHFMRSADAANQWRTSLEEIEGDVSWESGCYEKTIRRRDQKVAIFKVRVCVFEFVVSE